MRYVNLSLVLALFAAGNSFVAAQPARSAAAPTPPPASPTKPAAEAAIPARRRDDGTWPTRTFYLKYATGQTDININEIATTLRVLLPAPDQTMVIASESAIVVHAFPDDMALAQTLLDSLDRPKKSWRLTYTVTEVDGAKRLGSQHYSMVMVDGQQTTLKQGDRVPIATGSYAAKDASSHETVMNYQDVGMSFDAQLSEIHNGARLRSDVMQSSLADDRATATQDPVFRQATLRSEAVLTPGKPLVLGSMDIPGSTRHIEIEALIEPLP